MDNCQLCEEPFDAANPRDFRVSPAAGHRECFLRSGIGGIGHLIAHDYWCRQHDDPDAGLTYRQSAILTALYVEVVGVEATEPHP